MLTSMVATLVGWLHSRVSLRDETGATAVEYGIMVALIAAVIVAIVAILGGRIQDAFCTVTTALPGGAPTGCP